MSDNESIEKSDAEVEEFTAPNEEDSTASVANTRRAGKSKPGRPRGSNSSNKKRKTWKRGSSPSHFFLDESEELKFGPSYSLDLPERDRADQLFRAVSTLYYNKKDVHNNGTSVWVDTDYNKFQYPSLDLLLSPLRKPSPLDIWSPKEIAAFEAGICKCGKDFYAISKLVKSKTCAECVEFYYCCWKKSQHYQSWKLKRREDNLAEAQQQLLLHQQQAAASATV